jgi:hypothetical protein
MDRKTHWEGIYSAKGALQVSWFAPHLAVSLDLIRHAAPDKSARIIDVGGGASTLVDDLIEDGYTGVTVLDISSIAIKDARQRLGP